MSLGNASSPDAYEVESGSLVPVDFLPVATCRVPKQLIAGNPVASLQEDANTVHAEADTATRSGPDIVGLHHANSEPMREVIRGSGLSPGHKDVRIDRVEMGLPVSVRPPEQHRIVNEADALLDAVLAGFRHDRDGEHKTVRPMLRTQGDVQSSTLLRAAVILYQRLVSHERRSNGLVRSVLDVVKRKAGAPQPSSRFEADPKRLRVDLRQREASRPAQLDVIPDSSVPVRRPANPVPTGGELRRRCVARNLVVSTLSAINATDEVRRRHFHADVHLFLAEPVFRKEKAMRRERPSHTSHVPILDEELGAVVDPLESQPQEPRFLGVRGPEKVASDLGLVGEAVERIPRVVDVHDTPQIVLEVQILDFRGRSSADAEAVVQQHSLQDRSGNHAI
mmetsp:Transcript_18470/g.69881  ORF Transcript_18470/g.69881 Transcript_18470/m.69881 type:complete len:394 (-) Transcript_18470:247-1428(-)